MEEGLAFIALFILSLVAMGWIALILYGLHLLGSSLGAQYPSLRRPWMPTALICSIGLLMACGMMLVPVDRLTRFCFGIIVWLAVVHPLLVGYWSARSKFKQDNNTVLWKRTDKWLSHWENRRDSHR